jgi:hypothetical protein
LNVVDKELFTKSRAKTVGGERLLHVVTWEGSYNTGGFYRRFKLFKEWLSAVVAFSI